MTPERYFLGWDRPALHLVTDFLWKRFQNAGNWDMSAVVVAVPGARAGRRLLELLAWRAGEAENPVLLSPPRIVTAGRLPDRLYRTDLTTATELESLLARVHALRSAPRERLRTVFAAPPEESDFMGWLNLAGELETLDREFAAEELTCATVAEHCLGLSLHDSVKRWTVLKELQQGYLDALHALEKTTPLEAHCTAIENGRLHSDQTIFLISTVDLPSMTCRLLEASGSNIVALIHAPEEQAAGFDEFGRLRAGHWTHLPIPLEDEEIHIVDRPRDQAYAVLDVLEQLTEVPDENIVVGLGDNGLGATVERAIELSGHRARRAVHMKLRDSPPAQLLALLAAYVGDRSAAEFAALIRHPDLNEWLSRTLVAGVEIGGWAVECDNYRSRRLPIAIDAGAGGLPQALGQASHAILGLLPAVRRQNLAAWAQPIARVLETVYGETAFDETIPDQRRIIQSLGLIGSTLQSFGDLGEAHPYDPGLSFTEAISFLLSQAGEQPIPEESDDAPIELLGWLECHLDDSPVLIVTGFNEGFIPDSVNAAPLLPDALRRELGLVDNRRRYARDAYLLSAMKCSRQMLNVVCGRTTSKNDPLAPSRLLFACDEDAVVRRTLKFYSEHAAEPSRPVLLPHADEYRLAAIARPLPLPVPLNELSVTAFRDYLACPYRFLLKHVCKLRPVGDDLEELGGDIFGSIGHSVLAGFGHWVMREHGGYPPPDAVAIESFLEARLEIESEKSLGTTRLLAVQIQLHQLHRRLKAFAAFQAAEAAERWQIVHIEAGLELLLPRSDGDFRIHGRVDRIDRHPDQGYRIIDYKTSDGGSSPEKTHCRGKGAETEWFDLQLPLYRRIAPCLDIPESEVTVGYIVLPKDTKNVGFAAAKWDDEVYRSAYAMADAIIDRLRAQVFWPPNEDLPVFDDGFAAICLDGSLDRNAIIEKREAPPLYWPALNPESPWQLWPGWAVRDAK